MGGGRQVRAGEWGAAGGSSSTMRSPIAPDGWNDGESVRFSVPSDGTLQFLPGRLEITAGQAAGREIRFVRLPNTEPEITFGRNEGAPYRHVQLRDGTVSRLHARMRLHDGHWTLTNLSTTNPVTYNGRVLGDGEEQPLEQDDRIEMGEVAFRFRSR
jgi:pSer/pThr/pTyr-binding forkhead associated (FHA) protein